MSIYLSINLPDTTLFHDIHIYLYYILSKGVYRGGVALSLELRAMTLLKSETEERRVLKNA